MSGERERMPTADGRRDGLGFGTRFSTYLRTLALQSAWNGQRMQNLGLLVCLLPWWRRRERNVNRDRLFCRRYYEFFNTNPYLANYVIGGLIRLEEARLDGPEGAADAARTFRDSLGRAFASLGDQLFWLGIRPALTMGICLLGLAGRTTEILAVVAAFAIWQLGLRWQALGRGYDLGLDIVELLDRPLWHRAITTARRTGFVLAGALAGLLLAAPAGVGLTGERALPWIGLALGTGLPVLLRKRIPGEGLLLVAAFLSLVLAFAI